jgi:transposase
MKYRYSLVQYALSQGVGKAARKYNKGRSYIYFWTNRFDGDIHSLVSRSRRPKHHLMQHSKEGIKLIRRYWVRNPDLGLFELISS